MAPPPPRPHLAMVQADFAIALREQLFDPMPRPVRPHDLAQRNRRLRVAQHVPRPRLRFATAKDDQPFARAGVPAVVAGLHHRGNRPHPPRPPFAVAHHGRHARFGCAAAHAATLIHGGTRRPAGRGARRSRIDVVLGTSNAYRCFNPRNSRRNSLARPNSSSPTTQPCGTAGPTDAINANASRHFSWNATAAGTCVNARWTGSAARSWGKYNRPSSRA